MTEDKYIGCFLGLAVGDAYGAAFEGGPLERLLWKCIGHTANGQKRYTDDTQMSIDIAQSFLTNGYINQDHLATAFAKSYRWSRGYGPSAAKLLKHIHKGANWRDVNKLKFKEGSFGNGAAMRAPIVALCTKAGDSLIDNVVHTSEITHAHPLAIEGAQLIATSTKLLLEDIATNQILLSLAKLCHSPEFSEKLNNCAQAINQENTLTKHEVKKLFGNGIAATDSCITAIYYALTYRHSSFDGMLNEIFRLGGDADTIAAMAGALWGAANGSDTIIERAKAVEDNLIITQLAIKLFARTTPETSLLD